MTATGPRNKFRDQATKTAVLLSLEGDDLLEIYNFTFTEDDQKEDYATLTKKLDGYCAAKVNEVHECS